jgi:MFS transporter, putative metabolite:H+ symporter
VSWVTNLGAQTGRPEHAAFLMIWVNLGGFVGRILFSFLSDAIGRKLSGGIFGLGAAVMLIVTALSRNAFVDGVSVFWMLLILTNVLADGGFAIVGPYSAEVWPSTLRTSGMGSAYGFGGLGKVIGPLGLALIVGSSNVITPAASIAALVPAYVYLAAWFALAGIFYVAFGIETKGRSLEAIENALGQPTTDAAPVNVEPELPR